MNIYTYDVNYFENINTEEKAYWLGFISADGCITLNQKSYTLIISLQEKDKNVLEKFRKSIKGNMPIRQIISNKGKDKLESFEVRILVCSKKICEDLIKLGVGFRKTNNLQFPKIKKDLYKHFIRGYFDGDGCFTCCPRKDYLNKYRYGFEIVGNSEYILKQIQTIFKDNNITTNIYTRKTNNTKRLMTGSKYEILKIQNFLYKDASIYIERKHPKNILII